MCGNTAFGLEAPHLGARFEVAVRGNERRDSGVTRADDNQVGIRCGQLLSGHGGQPVGLFVWSGVVDGALLCGGPR